MFNNDCILIKDIRPGLKNINVLFMVLEKKTMSLTKENREVWTFKVADSSAAINVSVWDEPGKLLQPGDIVRLTKGYASIWRQSLTLYSGKNSEILKIGEFCMIFNEQLNMSESNQNFLPSSSAGGAPVGNENGGPPPVGVANSRVPAIPQAAADAHKLPNQRYAGPPTVTPPVTPEQQAPTTAQIKPKPQATRISRANKQLNAKGTERR
ncbi:SOSS complex subunit B homolog [Culicoides brevitarsis]|uniref:SOSS complex subunit B homolog n=1 Tax=Culicoides brevitarsis TaxID=469753 RepID=UPI00307B5A31